MSTRYPLDPAGPEAAAVRELLMSRQRGLSAEIGSGHVEREERGAEVLDQKDEATRRGLDEIGDAEIERDVGELREVTAALRRLEEGRYGLCEDCEATIDPRRLQAEPFAVRCTACQATREHTRRR